MLEEKPKARQRLADPLDVEGRLGGLRRAVEVDLLVRLVVLGVPAARGLGVSGAALKGAARFATGLADSTFNNRYSQALDAARLGETAAAQTGSYGTSAGQSIGSNLIGAGNAAAGGQVGAANALTGGLNGLGQAFLINRMFGAGSGGGTMYGSLPNGIPAGYEGIV